MDWHVRKGVANAKTALPQKTVCQKTPPKPQMLPLQSHITVLTDGPSPASLSFDDVYFAIKQH